ncbi:MAG: hypothetical protein J2P54_14175 [Bradyrhizobiaceae bacterium]|nr:hypothetical protein [Bradyrhizobiaceae bacterium]
MSKFPFLMLVGLGGLWLTGVAGAGEPPPSKYPQMYKFLVDMANNPLTGARSYFNCDYTTKICERGQSWSSAASTYRVFEALSDADRTTVLGHGACLDRGGSWVCWNFDKGVYSGDVNGSHHEGDMTVSDTYSWPRPIW